MTMSRHLDNLDMIVPLSLTVNSYQKMYGLKEAGVDQETKSTQKCLKVP